MNTKTKKQLRFPAFILMLLGSFSLIYEIIILYEYSLPSIPAIVSPGVFTDLFAECAIGFALFVAGVCLMGYSYN
jgi:hypothetical protein